MVEFLRKSDGHGYKIARVNSILVAKINQYTLILYSVGVRCDRGRFWVHSPFIEKSIIGY